MVAIKYFKQETLEDNDVKEAFKNEIDALSSINSLFVTQLLAAYNFKKVYYVVWEMPTAGFLNLILKVRGTDLSAEFCQYVLYSAAMGVKALHAKNFVHRKVGPSNMLCNLDGTIKLTDLD